MYRSKARIAGHPIHPMLIAFPVALYVATVVTLLVFVGTADPFWYRVALYANVGGVVMAAVAAIPGLIDLLSLPRHSHARVTGIRHAAFNILSLTLFVISGVLLYRNAGSDFTLANRTYELDVTAPLALSILGVLSTLAAGWLGWTLVQTHHVGIKTRASERSRAGSELDADELEVPHMPATYQETYRTTIRH
ncbi:MAG TPA: DUF2231 domain-containing protein [Kofleriaceae bacterium]